MNEKQLIPIENTFRSEEEQFIAQLYYSLGGVPFLGIVPGMPKAEAIRCIVKQQEQFTNCFIRDRIAEDVYANWDHYPTVEARCAAMRIQQMKCDPPLEVSVSNVYWKQTYEHFSMVVHVLFPPNEDIVDELRLAFAPSSYNMIWHTHLLNHALLAGLMRFFGYYETEQTDRGFVYKWQNPDWDVELLLRNATETENYFYPYEVSIRDYYD